MAQNFIRYVLSEVLEEAEQIRTFRLKPSGGESPPNFLPGQFFMLRLPELVGSLKPPFRSYSCLSPPGTDFLDFGIKLEGKFTTKLFSLKPGHIIEVAGPLGRFTLPDDISFPIVFLGGGIGITPLLCQIQYLARESHSLPFYLFYSSRHEKEVAYKGLIDSLSDINENFKPIYTLTREENEHWKGEKGRISREMIEKHLGKIPLPSCHYFLCGSPNFVKGIIEMLVSCGVGKERIHKEQW